MPEKSKKGNINAALLNKILGEKDPKEESTSDAPAAPVSEPAPVSDPEPVFSKEEGTVSEIMDTAEPLDKKSPRGKGEKRSAATYNVRPSLAEALKKIAFMTKRSISDVVEEAFVNIIAENQDRIEKYDKIRELLDSGN